MKKATAVLLALVIVLSLSACGKSKNVTQTEQLIESIGQVTIDSKDLIVQAQNTYDALSEKEKAEVENYSVLEKAQNDLAVAEEEYKQELAIDRFVAFIKENPVSFEDADFSKGFIDLGLIEEYKNELALIQESRIDSGKVPEITYAEGVVRLEEKAEYNDFIMCIYQTRDDVKAAFEEIQAVADAGSNVNLTVAFSKFNSAASHFESAQVAAEKYNQDAKMISDLTECYRILHNSSTNTATGVYTKSSLLTQIGFESISEQTTKYNVLWIMAEAVIDEAKSLLDGTQQ